MTPHPTRRTLLRGTCAAAAAPLGAGLLAPRLARGDEHAGPVMTAAEALERLRAGNAAFMEGSGVTEGVDHARRLAVAGGQAPFAIILTCSDSRVPPELLFSAGLGDLFVIRNAGNTVDTNALGSIEYGVLVLGSPLLVVMGHESCGAVGAAVEVVERNAGFPDAIGRMIEPIIPAVLAAMASETHAHRELLDASVRVNVERVVTQLRDEEPLLAKPVTDGTLQVIGARYDLDEGRVEFFEGA